MSTTILDRASSVALEPRARDDGPDIILAYSENYILEGAQLAFIKNQQMYVLKEAMVQIGEKARH